MTKTRNVVSKLAVVFLTAALFASLAGCASFENRAEGGTVVGILTGAAAGALADGPRGAVIGAMAGAMIGNRLGHYLDEREKKAALAASQEAVALETDQRQRWEVRDEEDEEEVTASGWVTPTGDIYADGDQRCRDVEFVSHKDGEEYVEEDTLCEADEGWITAGMSASVPRA